MPDDTLAGLIERWRTQKWEDERVIHKYGPAGVCADEAQSVYERLDTLRKEWRSKQAAMDREFPSYPSAAFTICADMLDAILGQLADGQGERR